MSVNDPIADMLTRVRNSLMIGQSPGSDAKLQNQGRNCPDP